jgi:hypothetical protein
MSDYEVEDRRHWAKKDPSEEDKEPPKEAAQESPHDGPKEAPLGEKPQDPPQPPKKEAPSGDDLGDIPVTFGTMVIGLGTTALIHMGEAPPDGGPAPPRDLKAAKHFIDLLGMLQQKTQGNLSEDEFQLLSAFLYDLRMKYVTLTKK